VWEREFLNKENNVPLLRFKEMLPGSGGVRSFAVEVEDIRVVESIEGPRRSGGRRVSTLKFCVGHDVYSVMVIGVYEDVVNMVNEAKVGIMSAHSRILKESL